MTNEEINRSLFSQALDQFEEAVRDQAFIGTKDLSERPEIEQRYAAKRAALVEYVLGIIQEKAT
jgi:hypothetical protein